MNNYLIQIFYYLQIFFNFILFYLSILLSNIKKNLIFYYQQNFNKSKYNFYFYSDSDSDSDSDSNSYSDSNCSELVDKLDKMGLLVSERNYNSAQLADTVSGTKFLLVQSFLLNKIILNSCYQIDGIYPINSLELNNFKNSNLITLESVKFNFVFAFQFTLSQILNKDVKNSEILMQDIIEYYYNINLTSSPITFDSLSNQYCQYTEIKNNKKLCKYLKEYVLTIRSILDQINNLYLVTTFDNLLTQEVIYFEPNTKCELVKKSGIVKLFSYNVQSLSGLETYVILYGYGFPIC
jgi:hypothetical protein